ncbi:lysosomal-associated transmembrane protein 4A isoform X2 [Lycorma delicatula]
MHSLSLKLGERREDWKCCFCCHVRTGTIFLGTWHLMLQVLALSVLAVMLRHPELMIEDSELMMGPVVASPPALPTPLSSEVDVEAIPEFQVTFARVPDHSQSHPLHAPNIPFYHRRSRALNYRDLNVGVVVLFCTFAITLLMVFGAIRGKPLYLMPFFCLQVFDFCIASLTAIGYVCYLPDVHRLVEEWPRAPFKSELLRLSPQCLSLLVLFTFMLAMLVKAYFIGVVWSCYKYLSLRLLASQRTIHYIDPDVQTLLPDYETAIKKFPPPPPSYATATASNGPTLASVTTATIAPPPYISNPSLVPQV